MLFKKEPKTIDKISPVFELQEDLKGKPVQVIISILASLLAASFTSGLLCQLWLNIMTDHFRFGLLNSFYYGFKWWGVTLLLMLANMYAIFRIYRILKKNYAKNYDDNYLKSDKETYGGAHFQTEEELKKNFSIYDSIEETTGDVFGMDDKERIYIFDYPSGMNQNKLFTGAPGSGKSDAIIKTSIYQDIRQGKSIITTDTKGALYAETSAVARKHGYKVRALMLKPEWFRNSDAFNMFADLKPGVELDSKADVIANILIKNTSEDERMDYWAGNELNLFKCCIMHIATDPTLVREGRNNLPELFNFLTTNNAQSLAGIFMNYPLSSPIRQCYNIFSNCGDMVQGQIINGASRRLTRLSNIYLQQVLSHNEIDLVEPMKRKCIYYIIMSDTDDAYKFVSALFFSSIFNAQCSYSDSLTREQKKLQLPVDYLCDEYANTGGIIGLPIKIATLRSRKIGITLILQDIGQLLTMYSESEAATILNCCVIKGLLSTNDTDTAKYFSEIMGNMTVLVENLAYMERSDDILHAHDQYKKTMGEGNRPLMMPDELMNGKFNRDEIIYVISGMPPVRLKKYFSKKGPEAIHPYEIEGEELGERKCNRHRPKWRKILEEKEAADKAVIDSMYQCEDFTATPSAGNSNPAPSTPSTYYEEISDPLPFADNSPANAGKKTEPEQKNTEKPKPSHAAAKKAAEKPASRLSFLEEPEESTSASLEDMMNLF